VDDGAAFLRTTRRTSAAVPADVAQIDVAQIDVAQIDVAQIDVGKIDVNRPDRCGGTGVISVASV
jgi:hypothetical protein